MVFYTTILFALCAIGCLADPVEKVGIKGKCPEVKFFDDFDASKFVGKWFAVRETGKEVPCVNYDVKEIEENTYSAKVEPKGVTMEFKKVPEGYRVNFPINPYMDQALLTVFNTDHVNYAGVYTCKYNEADDVYYQTVSFWSRSNSLSDEIIKSLSDDLLKYEVDESGMKVVKQEDCEAV